MRGGQWRSTEASPPPSRKFAQSKSLRIANSSRYPNNSTQEFTDFFDDLTRNSHCGGMFCQTLFKQQIDLYSGFTPMNAKLICIDDELDRGEIILDHLPVVVGRNPEAEVHLDDSCVSRFHCKIDEIDGTLVVRDLGSANGTYVNGACVTECQLLPDDQLTVGMSNFLASY